MLVGVRGDHWGWNETSRLASMDSLAERGTLAIDGSPFAWTGDKILVDGHFYSDKPLVPAVAAAPVAWIAGRVGLSASQHPKAFATVMSIATSGLAFIVSLWLILRIAGALGLPDAWALAISASFAFGSLVLPYARNVNAHILVLTGAMGVAETMLRFRSPQGENDEAKCAVRFGLFGGAAYAAENTTGLFLLIATGLYLLYRFRTRLRPALIFAAAAAPLLLAHHVLNFMVGHTIGPANAIPAYFNYPGSAFDVTNMTGSWQHPDVFAFLLYALEMLIGPRGFITYTPTVLLCALGLALMRPRGDAQGEAPWPEIVALTGFALATWLCLAALSPPYFGGWSPSVRWFLPFLAPVYLFLAAVISSVAWTRIDFLILAGGQAAISLASWPYGAFHLPPSWLISTLSVGTIVVWAILRGPTWIKVLGNGAPERSPQET
jgi:hypothetical protein